MKNLLYTLLITGLSALVACKDFNDKTAEATSVVEESPNSIIHLTKAQFNGSDMNIASISRMTFPETVTVNGVVDVPPENRALVMVPWGGYIRRAPLLVGDKVVKGQLLVTLENPEFVTLQQQYLETGDQLTYLKSEYERQKTLYNENIASQKNYLKAESDYKTALSRNSALAKQLSMLNIVPSLVSQNNIATTAAIYAPISGSVTQVNVTKGAFVSPASPLMEIIDDDHIHLELSVFEKDIAQVKKGQDIEFQVPEVSHAFYDGEVHLVGTSIGPDRMVKVHGHLKDESDHGFLTGMFVEARIIIGSSQVMALPTEAIGSIEEVPYVLHLIKEDPKGYEFEQLPVRTGRVYGDFTEITNAADFKTDDRFLGRGAFELIGQ